eukprot:GHVU01162876.1.p1 GENE.GHVU01162876.1~~GHVU01162876.1.p1  ORF type:complete len:222 (-),score=3.07 GHVU01162876.1:225-890(-)
MDESFVTCLSVMMIGVVNVVGTGDDEALELDLSRASRQVEGESLSRVLRRVRRFRIIKVIKSYPESGIGDPRWKALLDTMNFSGAAPTVKERENRIKRHDKAIARYLYEQPELRPRWLRDHRIVMDEAYLFGTPIVRIFVTLIRHHTRLSDLLESVPLIRLIWLSTGVYVCQCRSVGRRLINCLLGNRTDRMRDFSSYMHCEMRFLTRHVHIERSVDEEVP